MRQVTVTYHRENNGWWAESPDLDGYTAAASSFAQLRALVIEGVAFYLDDAPHAIAEKLDSGAELVDQNSARTGWTGSSWSGRLATADSAPRRSFEVRHAEYA